ncbi:hypothetical protein L249_1234 [Ophiocordyceps polyrhachis-furcata BCC 54312]|uniref:Integral membrane protein n=1 Tax=Ophiocordyceps polyrhachis-furcata BCC 54312 TaxID=1330021 RepID=A0A367LEH4_9HYPO|nr:hypothetical protein L249_1234 [Ophiocordyceps polyrhachis-furcata BCC 54312]
MNTTATYRMSTIITERQNVHRRNTFHPVDWPTLKQQWANEREWKNDVDSVSIWSDDVGDDDHRSDYGPREGIARMLTVYPVRDAAWITAVAFMLGGVAFTTAALFTLLPLLFPQLAFPGQQEVAFPAALTTGSAFFFIGGNLATLGAFNVGRGPEPADEAMIKKKSKYNPALLGSKEWVWFPPWSDFKANYLSNPAFRGGVIATTGGYVLTSATIIGFPGVLDDKAPDFLDQFKRFVMTPLLIGASFLGIGALVLTLVIQERWYKPAIFLVAWHSTFWNVVGAAFLAASAALTILGPGLELQSAIATTASSLSFITAASLQWYKLMEFYPRD